MQTNGQAATDEAIGVLVGNLPTMEIEPPIRAIYFLLHRNRVVYIGQTLNLVSRISQHIAAERKVFDEVRYMAMPSGNMNLVERELITRLKPKYNCRAHWKPLAKECSINRTMLTLDADCGHGPSRGRIYFD